MKKLIAILSVVLFATQISASGVEVVKLSNGEQIMLTKTHGRLAELIIMHGEILNKIDTTYHVKFLKKHKDAIYKSIWEESMDDYQKALWQKQSESIKAYPDGLYICSVKIMKDAPYYECKRSIFTSDFNLD